MFSYGPPQMAEPKQAYQHEPTYSNSLRIRDVALRTCQKLWTIGRSGERGSWISVLVAREDDDCLYRLLIYQTITYTSYNNNNNNKINPKTMENCKMELVDNRVYISFTFLAKILISSMYMRWFISSYEFVNIWPPLPFVWILFIRVLLEDIVAIITNLPKRYFFRFLLLLRFVLQLLVLLYSFPYLSWFCDLFNDLERSWTFCYLCFWDDVICQSEVILWILFFSLSFPPLECVGLYIIGHFFYGVLSIFKEIARGFTASNWFLLFV